MNILLVLTHILFLSFFSTSAFAEDESGAQGCPYFCSAQFGNDYQAMTDCMERTKSEYVMLGISCGGQAAATKQAVDPAEEAPLPQAPSACLATQREFESKRSECESSGASTGQSCDSQQNSALNSVSVQKLKGSSSVQDACKSSAKLMTSSKDALVQFAKTCRAAIGACNKSCAQQAAIVQNNPECFSGALKTQAQAAASNTCGPHNELLRQTEDALASYSDTQKGSDQCATETSGEEQAATEEEKKEGEGGGMGDLASMLGGMGGATPQEQQAAQTYCQANPTAMGCGNAGAAPNCMDPAQASTNPVCICSSNPNSPACSKEQNAGNQAAMSANQIDSSSRLAPSSMDGGGDIGNLPSIAQGPPNPGGPGDVIEGRQGSGNPVGEAGGGSGGKGFKAASGPADSDPLLRGQPAMGGGGGGRGGMMGFGGGGSGSSAGPPPPRYGSKGSEGGGSQTPDLRRFLPGGSFDPKGRGLAGTSGPDGITGPHSNIWQKVQNRYNVLAPTLMP